MMRRKAAADRAEKTANQRPASTRAAGAGGSSSTMLSKCCPDLLHEQKQKPGSSGSKNMSDVWQHAMAGVYCQKERKQLWDSDAALATVCYLESHY